MPHTTVFPLSTPVLHATLKNLTSMRWDESGSGLSISLVRMSDSSDRVRRFHMHEVHWLIQAMNDSVKRGAACLLGNFLP